MRGDERLQPASLEPNLYDLGNRVVSVATLPVMVSRLGWGLWFKSTKKMPWAAS